MKIYIRLLAIASVLFFTSCESWLDLQQEGEIESGNLFDKGEGYRVVLNGLYKSMGATALYGRNLSYGMVDCMSQQYDFSNEKANSDKSYEAFQDFKYEDNSVAGTIEGTWLAAFKVIANANDLIQSINNASTDIFEVGELERKMIMGEAYACRALIHFDLLRLFAPAPINDDRETYVPYVEDYPNIFATSIQVEPFLQKVVADLLKARELVAEYDTSAFGVQASQTVSDRTSLAPTNNPGYGDFFHGRIYRLNYYSITALLARVYQYANKDKEAFDCAKEVVGFGKEKDGQAFYEDRKDNFSGVLVGDPGDETVQAFNSRSDYKVRSSIIYSAYNKLIYNQEDVFKTMFKNEDGLTHNLYFVVKQMELFNNRGTDEWQQDIRSANMIYASQGKYKISGKWFIPSMNPEGAEHLKMSPVIRLTEMLYIMAECHARKGEYGEAYKILNDIRKNRNVSKELTVQGSFSEFVTDLIGDARREWISEGQLFYLYKRLDAPFMKNKGAHKLTKAEACLSLPSDQK